MIVLANELASLRHADRFFVGGEWVGPASTATIEVIDSGTEEVFFWVAEAQEADLAGAIAAARHAFDDGPWPRLTHAERAEYLQALATGLRSRGDEVAQMWPRESGILYSFAEHAAAGAAGIFEFYAELAHTFPFEEVVQPTAGGEFGLLIREPVGVVGALPPGGGVGAAILELLEARNLHDAVLVGNDTSGARCQLALRGDTTRVGALVLTNCTVS